MSNHKGKELWEIYKGPGHPRAFKTPDEMWNKAVDYFEWASNKYILQDKAYKMKDGPQSGDRIEHDFIAHRRPFTIEGLCAFLNIGSSTWYGYGDEAKYPEYSDTFKKITDIMFEQKFSGAAVGIYNGNIITRILNLSDSQNITVTKGDLTPWDAISDGSEDED